MQTTKLDIKAKKINTNFILLFIGFILLLGIDFRVIKKRSMAEDKVKLKTQNHVVSLGKFILY